MPNQQPEWEKEFDEEFDRPLVLIMDGFFKTDKGEKMAVIDAKDAIKSFIRTIIQKEREKAAEEALNACEPETLGKEYDGNNLREASAYHGIGADSWDEIVRYEQGHTACLTEYQERKRKYLEGLLSE